MVKCKFWVSFDVKRAYKPGELEHLFSTPFTSYAEAVTFYEIGVRARASYLKGGFPDCIVSLTNEQGDILRHTMNDYMA